MNEQVEKYLAPVRELNELAVTNIEKIVDLNMKRAQENARIGVEQMKNAASITDVDSLKSYLNDYAEIFRQVSEKTLEDARTAFELGNSYTTEAQRIVKEVASSN